MAWGSCQQCVCLEISFWYNQEDSSMFASAQLNFVPSLHCNKAATATEALALLIKCNCD
jgi:hypothetical protein